MLQNRDTLPCGELQGRQARIQRAFLDQLTVCAHCHQPPLVDDRDSFGMLHRGQAMGDHQRGAPGHQAGQRLLDQVLALCVEGAGGFIQQQDRRIHQQRPGNRQALPLPTGKPDAALTQGRLVALRQLPDEFIGIGTAGGCLDFRQGCLGPAIADVGLHRATEQRGVLRHQGELAAQLVRVEGGNRLAIEQDAPLLWVVKTQQQIEQGRLACTRGANQGNGLPWFDGQAQAIDGRHRRPPP